MALFIDSNTAPITFCLVFLIYTSNGRPFNADTAGDRTTTVHLQGGLMVNWPWEIWRCEYEY